MADLPEKHALTRRLIRGCEDALAQLESDGASGSQSRLQDVERRVKELRGLVQQMEAIFGSSFNMPLRERNDWKRKINSNVTAAADIEQSLRAIKGRLTRRQREDDDRAALLSGAHAHAQRSDAERDAAMLQRVRQNRSGVEEMLDQAANVLAGMGATRETLKKTQRKLLDMANSTGISDRILKLADRRNKSDRMIILSGMAVVALITMVALFWWKR